MYIIYIYIHFYAYLLYVNIIKRAIKKETCALKLTEPSELYVWHNVFIGRLMGLIPDTFNMKLVNNLKVRIQIQSFPNTARLVGILICIISCCCGIACGLMAMAIAWVYYRTG